MKNGDKLIVYMVKSYTKLGVNPSVWLFDIIS